MSKKRIMALLQYRHVLEPIKDNGLTFKWKNTPVPYYVIPATVEAYEQMLQQMHDAYSHRPPGNNPNLGLPSENRMRAALRAIGIKPPKKGQP